MIRSLIVSLGLTISTELVLGWILGIRSRKGLELVALVNVVTNPAVVFISQLCRALAEPRIYRAVYCGLELLAFLIEGRYYCVYLRRRGINGYLLSAVLNGASVLVGLLISVF